MQVEPAATRRRIVSLLPTGSTLPEESLRRRHRAILALLWMHVPALAVFGIASGHGVAHSLLEAFFVAIFAVGATLNTLSIKARAAFATIGLVSCSAILVHFSNGLIEMHFHFFVMVAVITLYQAWLPFILAIAFVVLHHGIAGAIDASSVYNHPAALADPWRWAMIHGLFIAGESIAGLSAWKMNEIGLEREQQAREELVRANTHLASAQALAHIGNWDWDIITDRVHWSDELCNIAGVPPESFGGTYDSFIALVHPEDRGRAQAVVEQAFRDCSDFGYQARFVRPDGQMRTVDALGMVECDESGVPCRMFGTVQDVSERKLLEDKIEYQSFHDTLTDLPNRSLFLDRVEHALRRQRRSSSPLAVLVLDLDDFKTVNDSFGHRAGDVLLVELAKKVEASLRPGDSVARLGGDEFAILLEDINRLDDAVMVVQRVLDIFRTPFTVENTPVFVNTSIGIAFMDQRDLKSPGDVLRDADTAMYAAKRGGKGTYEVFTPEMQSAAMDRLRLMSDLQRAVDSDEFFLNYQPLVNLETGRTVGVEALVRWNHPERGLISPGEFIPSAEESGLILPLGRWVLEQAASQAAEWVLGLPEGDPFTMSVNISGVRLRHPGLAEEVAGVLERTGLDPERLVLEITESVLVEDGKNNSALLAELKALGIKLAIDDFGTGYSSLSYLRDFPIDVLKVDKAFVDPIAKNADASALARAVIQLGEELGHRVVAEGVETHEQADVLRTLGCQLAQGFLYSKPVDEASILEILQRQAIANTTRLQRTA